MSDTMLLGILRMPVNESDPLCMAQFISRSREAADRIESDAEKITRLQADNEGLRDQLAATSDMANKLANAVSQDMEAASREEEKAAISALFTAHEDHLVFRENNPDSESQAWLLRKQAEAVSVAIVRSASPDSIEMQRCLENYAQRLLAEADEIERGGSDD